MRPWRGCGTIALLCILMPASLTAQTVRLAADALRDDIPARHLRWSVETTLHPVSPLYITFGAWRLQVDQDPVQGLPAIAEVLHGARAEAAVLIGSRAALTGRLGAHRDGAGNTDGEYLLRGQYAVAFGMASHALTATLLGEYGRARETAVATAIVEGIAYDRLTGGLDLRWRQRVSGAARISRDHLSDGNRRVQGYAYGLLRVLDEPGISVGYAYSAADSDVDHWRATGSTHDAATQSFRYRYFYYPYFTPMRERGHAALAVLNWTAGAATIAASTNVPLASRGSLQASPEQGPTVQPISHGYYEAAGILPVQASLNASVPLAERLRVGGRYEYFSKTYYSYHSGGLSLQLTF
jgi:hypothetical protein